MVEQAGPDPAATVQGLLPDLGDRLVSALVRVEELLTTLTGWEQHALDRRPELPGPLAGGVALAALHRVQARVAPTQSRPDRPVALLCLFGADGRRELSALRPAGFRADDLAVLDAAAQCLGLVVATGDDGELVEAIGAGVEAGLDPLGPAADPAELVATFARINGLLQGPGTGDAEALFDRLTGACGPVVVLSADQERAHHRLMAGLTGLWAVPDHADGSDSSDTSTAAEHDGPADRSG